MLGAATFLFACGPGVEGGTPPDDDEPPITNPEPPDDDDDDDEPPVEVDAREAEIRVMFGQVRARLLLDGLIGITNEIPTAVPTAIIVEGNAITLSFRMAGQSIANDLGVVDQSRFTSGSYAVFITASFEGRTSENWRLTINL